MSGGGHAPSSLNHVGIRTGRELVKKDDFDARILQYGRSPGDVAARHQARVGHQERPMESQPECELAKSLESAFREHNRGARMEVEWLQRDCPA
jgi:hypothetical protein